MMKHASLFSGIGGFDLAAEWAGWQNMFNCEIDKFCQRVLKYHFPKAAQYGDIKTTDFSIWRGEVDVLSGGFPCQPFSVAGNRKGTNDERYLWPEMLRAIQEIRPRWIVGENVRGFVSWSDGMVLETVCSDLENAGYEVQPFLIPACAVGAPHRRDRIWIVAHASKPYDAANAYGDRQGNRENEQIVVKECSRSSDAGFDSKNRSVTHTDGQRCNKQFVTEKPGEQKERYYWNDNTRWWEQFPTKSPICGRNDGISGGLDGITFPAWCRESIKAYGNAIVPQVAYNIFEAINRYEDARG